ncbi:MAG: GTP-dependent dephospho-CoA kinase family protein [Candidatus Hadarchaeales archaeon]
MNHSALEGGLIMPEELRAVLRRPLGRLFPSPVKLVEFLSEKRPISIITVGDRTSVEMIKSGIKPDITVVDFKEMREPVEKKARKLLMSFGKREKMVTNPPGTITPGLIAAIADAEKGTRIIVNGEEDLAVLPAVLLSKEGTVVIYGQPKEGIVLIEVTVKKKEEVAGILKKFKRIP